MKTGVHSMVQIDPNRLSFPRGTPTASGRSILDICEHTGNGAT